MLFECGRIEQDEVVCNMEDALSWTSGALGMLNYVSK